eukprot:3705076-Rhodomonas_salina.2
MAMEGTAKRTALRTLWLCWLQSTLPSVLTASPVPCFTSLSSSPTASFHLNSPPSSARNFRSRPLTMPNARLLRGALPSKMSVLLSQTRKTAPRSIAPRSTYMSLQDSGADSAWRRPLSSPFPRNDLVGADRAASRSVSCSATGGDASAEANGGLPARRLCVAPMMDWTDRFDRYFLRLFSKNTWLYTEMITTGALIHGDSHRHLQYHDAEHPIAVQLGGSEPADLAKCAKMCEGHYLFLIRPLFLVLSLSFSRHEAILSLLMTFTRHIDSHRQNERQRGESARKREREKERVRAQKRARRERERERERE